MRSWHEAIGHFDSALLENANCKLAAEKLAKAKARLEESRTGKYNLGKLIEDEKSGQRFMDVADYIGPVKIAEIPGKGKSYIIVCYRCFCILAVSVFG
jgi:hypothetical protein